jgi:RNA polymerase primary sigma factor
LGRIIQAAAAAQRRWSRGDLSLAEKEEAERKAVQARDEMIRANLRLVVKIARNYTSRGMVLADLIEEGNLGLLRAVEGYDPVRDTRFSTYASWWIKQAIKRALINSVQPVHIPAYMVEMIAKWKQGSVELQSKLNRQPTIEEMGRHLGLSEKKVRIIRRAVRAFSSHKQSGDSGATFSLDELLADKRTPPPEEAIFDAGDTEFVQRLLDRIDEREAKILRLRFGLDKQEPMTLKQIGKAIGLTRERVRQIEREALRKLNDLLSEQGIPL